MSFEEGQMVRRSFYLIPALVTFLTQAVNAGSRVIGQIPRSDGASVSGIAFDDLDPLHEPVVGDMWGRALWRVSLNDATIRQTYAFPDTFPALCLEYIGNSKYLQVRDSPHGLSKLDVHTGAIQKMGPISGTGRYNFMDIAMDPTTGTLWMFTDESQGLELYTLDQSSGVATHKLTLSSDKGILTSMAIGPGGEFYVTNYSGVSNGVNSIFKVDLSNGHLSAVTATGYFGADFLTDFKYDAYRGKWFGVLEQRMGVEPDVPWLVELTGIPVPEPASLIWLAAGTLLLHRRAHVHKSRGCSYVGCASAHQSEPCRVVC
jgi:hypothetical protein